MLRRGLAALVVGAVCAVGVSADDAVRPNATASDSPGVVGWIREKTSSALHRPAQSIHTAGAIQQAAVTDAERQDAQIRSAGPQLVSAQSSALDITSPEQSAEGGSLPHSTGFQNAVPVYPAGNAFRVPPQVPVHSVSMSADRPAMQPIHTVTMQPPAGPQQQIQMPQQFNGYPQTGAALYPTPVPGVPQQVGGSAIVNQAFHPHEMLYAHRYRAMYGPYSYKVTGGWIVTPFGVWSQEDWKLQGTMVDVKYKSHISPFAHLKYATPRLPKLFR